MVVFHVFSVLLFLFKSNKYIVFIRFSKGRKRLSVTFLFRKGVAVAAVVFFLIVSISPGFINPLVCASSTPDSYAVTVKVCGVKGYQPYTVFLPEEQYSTLIQYLDGVTKQSTLMSDPVGTRFLFRDVVSEIDSFGLLAPGIRASQLQQLLQATTQSFAGMNRWKTFASEDYFPKVKNSFCGLFAVATKIQGYSPDPIIIPFGLLLVLGLVPSLIVSVFGQAELANQLADLGVFLWRMNPLRWFNFVLFKGYDMEFRSLGLKGLVHETLYNTSAFWGFTGLMVQPQNEKTYFVGFSLAVYSPM
jgi:hypothetical protein